MPNEVVVEKRLPKESGCVMVEFENCPNHSESRDDDVQIVKHSTSQRRAGEPEAVRNVNIPR